MNFNNRVSLNLELISLFLPRSPPPQTISKTLNPQWREQFDFHLYDEQGGFVDITVWDKDAGKKDDFMGRYGARGPTLVVRWNHANPQCCAVCPLVCHRCTIDLSLLGKERTHKLDVPLEEGRGVLLLLVTLTASAAVSISDLSVNMLDDPHERHQIMQRYVSFATLIGRLPASCACTSVSAEAEIILSEFY